MVDLEMRLRMRLFPILLTPSTPDLRCERPMTPGEARPIYSYTGKEDVNEPDILRVPSRAEHPRQTPIRHDRCREKCAPLKLYIILTL